MKSIKDIYKIFEEEAKVNQSFAKQFYKAKGKAKEYSNEEVAKAVVEEKEEDFGYDKSIPQE